MTDTYNVRVFINKNIKKFVDAYQPNDDLVEALEFELESESVDMVLACTFAGLNMDNSPGLGTLSSADLLRYHLSFPSLSVGDVVEVGGYKFACEPIGWKEIGPRQVICKLCRHMCWTGDDHNVCADCRQGDWATDLEAMEI